MTKTDPFVNRAGTLAVWIWRLDSQFVVRICSIS
jgi:hypothetical protein